MIFPLIFLTCIRSSLVAQVADPSQMAGTGAGLFDMDFIRRNQLAGVLIEVQVKPDNRPMQPKAPLAEYLFDGVGNVRKITRFEQASAGRETLYEHDAGGKLLREEGRDPLGPYVRNFTYDHSGFLIRETVHREMPYGATETTTEIYQVTLYPPDQAKGILFNSSGNPYAEVIYYLNGDRISGYRKRYLHGGLAEEKFVWLEDGRVSSVSYTQGESLPVIYDLQYDSAGKQTGWTESVGGEAVREVSVVWNKNGLPEALVSRPASGGQVVIHHLSFY